MAPEARRLHPLSWIFLTASSVKSMILPAFVVLVAWSSTPWGRYELLSFIFIAPIFVNALLKQGVYTYWFDDDELVIREGILNKKERHIPFDRVHNVTVVRNPFHRMLGVATARVETAAGGQVEASIQVLTLAAVDELKEYTLGKKTRGAMVEPAPGVAAGVAVAAHRSDPETLVAVPPLELARLGLISNRGFVVVAGFMGLVSQANIWDLDWESYYDWSVENAPELASQFMLPGSWQGRVFLSIGLLATFVVLLRVFSVVWYLVRYYGFTLEREDQDLRTEFGMLTQVSTLIPVNRIQLLSTNASLLHRWAGRIGIDMETAGGSQTADNPLAEITGGRQWLAPILEADQATGLIRDIMPEVDLAAVEWHSLAPGAARRMLKKLLLAVAVLTALLISALSFAPIRGGGFHGLWLPAIALPIVYFGVTTWVRNAGYALSDTAVLFRSGWLARKVSVVRFNKVQSVWMHESPFDRRHHMATVRVDTAAAGGNGHRIDIPYLDRDLAQRIFQRLYGEATATEYSW